MEYLNPLPPPTLGEQVPSENKGGSNWTYAPRTKDPPQGPRKPNRRKTTFLRTTCIFKSDQRPSYNLGCPSPTLRPSIPASASCNLCSLSNTSPKAPPSSLASNSANCAGTGNAADGGPRRGFDNVPSREGVLWVINSVWTGNFICARRSAVISIFSQS